MIREELQRDKLRGRAARRAWNYEKRLEERKKGSLFGGNEEQTGKGERSV